MFHHCYQKFRFVRLLALVLAAVFLAGAVNCAASPETNTPQQWYLHDALHRLETGDMWTAASLYRMAIAADPAALELLDFPLGELPLSLAGDILLTKIALLEDEPQRAALGWENRWKQGLPVRLFIDGESREVIDIFSLNGRNVNERQELAAFVEAMAPGQTVVVELLADDGGIYAEEFQLGARYRNSLILPLLMLSWWEYGVYAAAAGHYDLASDAALAAEAYLYSHGSDPGLNLSLLQASTELLRSLIRASQQDNAANGLLAAQADHIEAVWPDLQYHVYQYPQYWQPLLRNEALAQHLPVQDLPALLVDSQIRPPGTLLPYPDTDGRLLGASLEIPIHEPERLWEEASMLYQEFLQTRDPSAFGSALERSLALNDLRPDSSAGWFLTGQLLAELKDDDHALEWAADALIKSLDLQPDLLEAQLLLAQVLLEQGRFYSAADQYTLIIERFQEPVVTGLVTAPLTFAYIADGRIEAGRRYFLSLLRQYNQPCILFSLAILEGTRANTHSALAYIEQIREHPKATELELEYAELLQKEYEAERNR